MATRMMSRSSLSSIKSAIRSKSLPSPSSQPLLLSTSRRFSFSRIPSELGGVMSMLPLHNAVSTARLTSCLSTTSITCRSLSQGTLCCTSPGL